MNNDLISRQAMLDGLASIAKAKAKSDAQKSLIGRVMFFTEHLPSVNPQKSCEDAISRQVVLKQTYDWSKDEFLRDTTPFDYLRKRINDIPPVTPQEPKTGRCKECKYFEYDSVAKVDGIPLIVAHEICSRWGDGCKTREDGYCFLFEPQESEDKE